MRRSLIILPVRLVNLTLLIWDRAKVKIMVTALKAIPCRSSVLSVQQPVAMAISAILSPQVLRFTSWCVKKTNVSAFLFYHDISGTVVRRQSHTTGTIPHPAVWIVQQDRCSAAPLLLLS